MHNEGLTNVTTPGDGELHELRERVRALEAERDHLRNLLRSAGDIIVTTDVDGRITEFNEVAEQLFQAPRSAWIGRHAGDLYVDRRARQRLLETLDAAADGVVREDVLVRTSRGERRWLGLSLSWLRGPDGKPTGTVGVGKDVTERRLLEEELKRLTITDKLTGLHNQGHFFESLEIEKERSVRLGHALSLLLFDLDGFKRLNDTKGHREGDVILRRIGAVLMETIRKEVDSAYRYGGDEFTVLLPGADRTNAVRFAERVRRQVVAAVGAAGITPSMGVCEFLARNRALQLVEKADEAMFLAKRTGGNRIAYYELERDRPVLVDGVEPLAESP